MIRPVADGAVDTLPWVTAGGAAGAYSGDVGAAAQMVAEDVGHGQVDHQISSRQNDIVLADLLEVGGDAGQGLQHAPIFPVLFGVAEGGQDPQAAVLAAQVPILTGTHVVQQGLIALVNDNAHVGDTGVDVVGEHEINQAVTAAEGQGAGVARTGQLPQIGIRAASEDNSVQIVHACSPPFTSSRIIALGLITALGPTVTPPATTAMPQSGSSEGGAPTVASSSMTAPSATMA